MFIVGIRDKNGITLTAQLFLTWLFSLLALLYAPYYVSLMVFVLCALATGYGAWLFMNMRDTLVFSNEFSRELAFPSSRGNEWLVFAAHALIVVFVFIPNAAMLFLQPSSMVDPARSLAVSIMYFVGYVGVVGLALQVHRKIRES